MVTFALPTCDSYAGSPGPQPVDHDAALMLLSRDSVDDTFGTLVARYQNPLLTFFQKQGAREESSDLAQETFIRLYRYRDRYQATSKFSSFLYTLARHAWADHGRKSMRRERLVDAFSQASEIGDFGLCQDVDPGVDLEAARACLSPKLQQVIELYFYEGLRLHEISSRLAVPLGTVKSRLNHAIRDLRAHVQGQKEDAASQPSQRGAIFARGLLSLWSWGMMSLDTVVPVMV